VFENRPIINEFKGKDREFFGNLQEKWTEFSGDCMKWQVGSMK
jgi:hypothetical protein